MRKFSFTVRAKSELFGENGELLKALDIDMFFL
jgi:hypothetical protein